MTASIGTPALWAGFVAFVVAMLALDLFVFDGRRAHRVSVREALGWSVLWVVLAFAFAGLLWWHLDATAGRELANAKVLEFVTGYLIEKSLSVDNIFVFVMIFTYFAVPAELQRRVLLLGVLGAIALRAAMILAGSWAVERFDWILYVFGAFLVATGIKMLIFAEAKPDLAKNPIVRWLKKHFAITHEYHGERFVVWQDGVRHVTPLFVVLVLIEASDVVFAVDSIPAIFAITTDPFIVFTSNIFAILGLRALYFLLADMADRFHLLKYGLALVLVFVGAKMLAADFYHVPTALSLGVVGIVIASAMLASVVATRRRESARGPL